MKPIYIKWSIKGNLKLSRNFPAHLSMEQGEMSTDTQKKIVHDVKTEAREAIRYTTKRLTRTIDPYRDEETHDLIQSLSTTKDAAGRVKKGYKIYKGISKEVKLKRNSHPSVKPGELIRAAIKERIADRLQTEAKNVPRKTAKHVTQTLDPYHEEEAHDMVQAMSPVKDAAGRAKKGYKFYKEISRTLKEKRKPTAIKSGNRARPMHAFRKIKGSGEAPSAGTINSAAKIKTLSSKFVPKNKVASIPIKAGIKRASSSAVRAAVQQAARRLAAAVAANPKVWLIAAAAGGVFFLLMSVLNGLGGSVSSAGSFFMTDDDNARKYKAVVDERNAAFQAQIERFKNSSYDDLRIEYMNEDGTLQVNWVEIFALVAVKFEQDLTLTAKQNAYISTLFNHFNKIDTDTERYYITVCSTTINPKTRKQEVNCHEERRTRLFVKVYSYDMEDVFEKIGFNEEQREWARRLVTSGAIQEQFPDLGGGYTGGTDPNPGSLSPEEMVDLINNLGGDIAKARRKLIETAVTLAGKVPYFWGGKSPAGWNDNWGKPMLVTAPGSDKTGTYQPYGLDCSGFIDWAFKTAGLGNVFSRGGTTYQWNKTYSISKDEMIPGDLIFKNIPGQGGVNHIGIFIGKDENGNNLYVHSQGGTGVIISSYKGFKYPRRPLLFK